MLRCAALFSLLLAAAAAPVTATGAETYPSRPLRLVIPYAPGGSTDILGRLIGAKLSETWGQQVVIDNRPGGNAMIGSTIVAKAPADGYTLIMATNGSHGINMSLYPNVPYDPLKDFTPLIAVAGVPMVLVVTSATPVKSAKELVSYALAQDGKVNYGSAGTGSTGHLTAEIFKTATGIKGQHIPYKSDGPALVDLMGGQFTFIFSNMPAVVSYVKAGRVRALAVSVSQRSPLLPDVPTLTELGIKVEIIPWYGVMGPAGISKPVAAKLNAGINRVLESPEFKERLVSLGATVMGGTPEQFVALIQSDIEKYAKAVKDSGAKPD
ncbi:MAG: Bug family tripartite tricarboxylate transporter substrate binding protein [Burkholderiales bacterium]